MWLVLANGHGDAEHVEHVLPDLEALGRFAEELRGRLAADGLDGIEGTLALYRRLKGTLDSIEAADIERIRADIHVLERWAGEAARFLADIARLKRLVDG